MADNCYVHVRISCGDVCVSRPWQESTGKVFVTAEILLQNIHEGSV